MRRISTWLLAATSVLAPGPASALNLALLQTRDGAVGFGQFGFSIAVVGDMDGDGFAEYAVGASTDSTPGPSAGRVFVFRGGDSHANDPPAWVIDGLPGDLLGFSLSPAGDQDGDGLADLLIGAPGNTGVNPAASGRAIVAYGSSPLGMRALASLSGDSPGDRFGHAVALVDWDGDQDVAVGAPGKNFDSGAVRVFHGGDPPTPAFTIHARGSGDEFGSAVAGVGRTRGPAAGKDMVVGAPFNSDFDVWAGAVYLHLGGAGADTLPDRTWTGGDFADLFGSAVAGAGDVNGDGRSDVLVGAPGGNTGLLTDAGLSYLFLGAPVPPLSPAVTIAGTRDFGELGLSVAGIGDVDGDLLADFAIGTPGQPDASIAGEVWVFRGSSPPPSSPDTVLIGENVDDMFGHSISNGGDIRGGPEHEFLVGADEHLGKGRAYLYGAPGVVAAPVMPMAGIRLLPPSPNPAARSVRLSVELDRASAVKLEIADIGGRRVATLFDGRLEPGRHEFGWGELAARHATPPGLYGVLLTAGGERQLRKFVYLGR